MLGAGQHADRVADRHVSRLHAQVGVLGDGFYVVDLGSRNGTYVNGRPIPARKARPIVLGDEILFGATTMATVEAPA